MSSATLSGVYAAAVTPLKPDFSPDLEAIPHLLGFLAGRGCHGALVLGTTGEGPSFSPAERRPSGARRGSSARSIRSSACWPAPGRPA